MGPLPVRARHGVLVSGWLILTFESAVLIAPAGVLPLIIADLAISPAFAGALVSAFFFGQVVAGIPAGFALDVRDETRILGASVLTLVIAGVLWWIAAAGARYWMLAVARCLAGMAGIVIVVAGTNLVGQAFPAERQGSAVAAYTTAGPAGIALGQVTAPVISNTVGWESLSLLFAVGAVIAFLPLLLIDRLAPSNGSTSSPPSVGDLAAVLRDTTVWQLGSLYFASLSIFFILSSWMPSYLTTAFDVDIAESGLLLGIFTFVGIFGRSSGGVISDRIFGRRRRPVVLLSFSTTALLVAALAGLNVPTAVFIVLVVSGFAVQMSVGVLYAHVRDLVDRSVQGTAVSVFLLIGTCGSLTAPVVTGFLIEVTPGFMAAFGYAIALAVLAVILAWLAPEA